MANEKSCQCAKENRCKLLKEGLIFYRGKHVSTLEAARLILNQKCWKGAEISTSSGYMVARKGTAEIRFVLSVDASKHNCITQQDDAGKNPGTTRSVMTSLPTSPQVYPQAGSNEESAAVPPVSCVVIPFKAPKADGVEAGARAIEEQVQRVAELEAALQEAEKSGRMEKAEPWRCMECGKEGLSAMPAKCPSCSSARLSFDYGRPAAEDWKRRELMAQKFNPPREEYEHSTAWSEKTTFCRNPFAAVR